MRMPDKNELLCGSMLWIKPWSSPEQIRSEVSDMVSRGLLVARIFLPWVDVSPAEGTWDYALFDTLFSAAEEYGLLITLTLGAGAIPPWAAAQVPEKALRTVDHPAIWENALAYVRETVLRYKDSPALHSWILWNEPSKATVPNRLTLERFREFLKTEHGGDEEHLRRAFGGIRRFEDVGTVLPDGSGEFPLLAPRPWGYGPKMDWERFCVEDMNRLLKDIGGVIRSLDTVHPTTVNPCHVGWQLLHNGQDIWSEGELVDFLGCSCHTCSYDRPLFDRKHQHLSLVVDAIRSATSDPDEVFWLTELQGGSIVYAGVRGFTPTAADITHWLWEAYGSGAKGVVYWLYAARDAGYEAGEWGLVNQYLEPSDRSVASEETARLLYRERDFFKSLRSPVPDVFVLYSLTSMHLGALEVEVGVATHGIQKWQEMDLPRNYKLGGDAMFGAYSMAQDIGLHCGFAYEGKVTRKLPADGVLLCGGGVSLLPGTVKEIRAWVEGGGTVIVDSIFAMKDMWGLWPGDQREDAEALFGTRMTDVHSRQEDFCLDADGMSVPAWYVDCEFDESAIPAENVLARSPEGRVTAFRRACGKGQAIWIGTMFFQRYTGNPSAGAREFLRGLLPDRKKPFALVNPSEELRMKRLAGGGNEAVILLNYRDRKLARLFCERTVTFTDMMTGERFALEGPGILNVPMPRESTRVLRAERR